MIVATWNSLPKGIDAVRCRVGAETLEARSQHGAGHRLARMLRRRGVPDDVLSVTNDAGTELFRFRSFYAAAQYSIQEGASGEELKKVRESGWSGDAIHG